MFAADDNVPQNKRIYPDECSFQYASPQHLRSLQLQLENDWPETSSEGSDDTAFESQDSQPISQTSQPGSASHVAGTYNRLMHKLRSFWKAAMFKQWCGTGARLDARLSGEVDMLIDGRTADIWSIGVVLYEMVRLAGRQYCSSYL